LGLDFIGEFVNERLIDAPSQAFTSAAANISEGTTVATGGGAALLAGLGLYTLDSAFDTENIGISSQYSDELAGFLVKEGAKSLASGASLATVGYLGTSAATNPSVAYANTVYGASTGLGEDDTPLEIIQTKANEKLGVTANLKRVANNALPGIMTPDVDDEPKPVKVELAGENPAGSEPFRAEVSLNRDREIAKDYFYAQVAQKVDRDAGIYPSDEEYIQYWMQAEAVAQQRAAELGRNPSTVDVGSIPITLGV